MRERVRPEMHQLTVESIGDKKRYLIGDVGEHCLGVFQCLLKNTHKKYMRILRDGKNWQEAFRENRTDQEPWLVGGVLERGNVEHMLVGWFGQLFLIHGGRSEEWEKQDRSSLLFWEGERAEEGRRQKNDREGREGVETRTLRRMRKNEKEKYLKKKNSLLFEETQKGMEHDFNFRFRLWFDSERIRFGVVKLSTYPKPFSWISPVSKAQSLRIFFCFCREILN